MSAWLGVDPGKVGAVAAVDGQGDLLWVRPTPMVAGKTADYDLPGIVAVLREAAPRFVLVERLSTLPPMLAGKPAGGGKANFARGVSHGWAWMLTALGIPFAMVAPQTWQKAMLAEGAAGETGQRSILAAQRLWPSVEFRRSPRCRKLDDGLTDAALMAEYGRRLSA